MGVIVAAAVGGIAVVGVGAFVVFKIGATIASKMALSKATMVTKIMPHSPSPPTALSNPTPNCNLTETRHLKDFDVTMR